MNDAAVQNLTRDHAGCEGSVATLEALLDAFHADLCWTAERSQAFRDFGRFFEAEILSHMRKEDEVLYPALEEFLPRDVGPLVVLRSEHAEMYANFVRMMKVAELLDQESTSPELEQKLLFYGRTLVQIMRDHIYKEQQVLFPMVMRYLNAEQDRRIAAEMEAMDAARSNPALFGRTG